MSEHDMWFHAMDWHSQPSPYPRPGVSQLPGDAPWEIRHKIPADMDWLSTDPFNHDDFNRLTYESPVNKLKPGETRKWYHTTPADLKPGDRLTPRGGPSPDEDYYDWPAMKNRQNHVWVSPSPQEAHLWKDWAGSNSKIYEVHPGDTPQPWQMDPSRGYVAPHAVIKRRVGRYHWGSGKYGMAAHDGVFWHGSPSGELVGSPNGLHVGSYEAARDALESRIGTPADGKPWDGTRTYGETMLNRDQVSHQFMPDRSWKRVVTKQPPELPSGRAQYGDGTPIPMDSKPNLFPVRITGPMSNTPETPHPDFKANGYMRAQITRGNAKRGYYYTNEGEGVTKDPLTGNLKYSISAVVPNGGTHLERLDRAQHPFPPADPERPNTGTGYNYKNAMAEYDEYAGHHHSPGPGTGFPIHDMHSGSGEYSLGGVPEDWQTHPHWYASSHEAPGTRGMKETQRMYNRVNGNPEAPVDIYRALPHGNTDFHTGDWVTPSLAYAQGHAASESGGDWPVIKSTVPAKHLWQNGDSYYEMGYHGPSHQGTVVGQQKIAVQQPHPGLQLHYFPDQESVDKTYGAGGEIQAPVVTAHHPDSKYQPTGFLQWDTADHMERPNVISWIDVDPDFRRQGIGAAMFEHAKKFNPDIQHSPQRSIEGDDWAHAVGGDLPPLMDEDEVAGEDW